MPDHQFKYIIVGGGLAGASALEGIREIDGDGNILIIAGESHLPYHRPPLTKGLWTGKKQMKDIFVYPDQFYSEHNAAIRNGINVVSVVPSEHKLIDEAGSVYGYEKLLLATGGIPKRLPIPGCTSEGVLYYRYADDYINLKPQAVKGKSALVIGGGFIGAEVAAALNMNGLKVTMVYPDSYMLSRVIKADLGDALQQDYSARGVEIISNDSSLAIEKTDSGYLTSLASGKRIKSDILVVGIGIAPATGLAAAAGLACSNGIIVNEHLQTSDPDIYAAGDNAMFPYRSTGSLTRIEHWDNSLSQGKHVGRNMAGANEPFTYMPYFFSDLFDFGFEAIGDLSPSMETFADWTVPFKKGVIYYLRDGKVKGAMMCDIWGKVDSARALISEGKTYSPEDLRGVISE